MWNKYDNYRTVKTLKEIVQLRLKIRRCSNLECERYHQADRPEQESRWALPQHEVGLDVIALIGAWRYQCKAVCVSPSQASASKMLVIRVHKLTRLHVLRIQKESSTRLNFHSANKVELNAQNPTSVNV